MLLLIILLILIFGLGGWGYHGTVNNGQYYGGPGIGVVGIVLVIILVVLLLGDFPLSLR